MVVLIDNYDSFSYNLYQMIGEITPDIQVVRNDALSVEELAARKPDRLILSPGPGRPDQAGICEEAVRYFAGKVPMLGVCLGHQAICEAFGGKIIYAKELMHGKQSVAKIDVSCPLFRGMSEDMVVGRYHSLAVQKETLPKELQIIAETEAGEVMAVKHKNYEIFGVQFHPESILTPEGRQLLQNFIQ